MTSAPPPGAGRFAGLDGLRAIAVGAVLLYHLSPGALVGGYLGVDIFFVISGFLITALALREHEGTGRIDLRAFWVRRARRLLPAIGLLLLACSTAAWAIGGNVLVGLGRQLIGAATFSSNWLSTLAARSYFDDTSPELFRNLWSLAVEEQFYLLWPLMLSVLLVPRRVGWRWVIVGVLAGTSALAMAVLFVPGSDATRVYYGTDTHSFGLLVGALTAFAARAFAARSVRRPSWQPSPALLVGVASTSLAGLVVAMVAMPADSPVAYRGGLVGVALLTAALIGTAIVPGSPVGSALDGRLLRWVGTRSYGLYLWHWPVFVLLVAALPEWPRTGAGGWVLGAIALGVSTAAAWFSHRYVETPIRRRGVRGAVMVATSRWRGSRRGLVAGIAAAALLVGGGAGTAAALAASPYRSDAQANIEEGIRAIEDAPAAPVAPVEPSTPATLPGGDQITAIGDSVMLASAPGLQAAFPGIAIDAAVSRQLSDAPALVDSLLRERALRPVVLIGLGTNGPIDGVILERIRRSLGSAHKMVVVNVQAPRGWTDGVNQALTSFAGDHRDVELANWRDAISGQLSLLARDQIHPGSRGGEVYAGVVREALQRLAAIPPLLRPSDYGLAPRPE